jgi:hypothetical protein
MADHDAPSWITVARGPAPILLLAPHGGRRHDTRIPGRHKVNDLLTADVTRALASACGASVIVNEGLDRNQLDLNRLSQVRRAAPWMITLLADMLAAMVSEAGHATVLVVHGWNVTQAACDIGIGMRELSQGLVPVRADTATASDAFVATRIRPLQEAAADAGIAVTIGSRYPGAHPNNLLQIFRGVADPGGGAPCPIAALCRDARIEAAQLELAIPLRWPGPRRDQFLALVAEVLANGTDPTSSVVRPARGGASLRSSGGRVTRRRGLQFVADEMLVMASIDAGDEGPIAGRLVINRDADRLVLFTGELGDPAVAWTIPPLAFQPLADGGARVVYEGPLVGFSTLTPFLDLEHGLASGVLIEGRMELIFRADAAVAGGGVEERFGDVRGKLVVDGRSHGIAARAVAIDSDAVVSQRIPNCRIILSSSPWGSVMLEGAPEEPLEWRDGDRMVGTLIGTRWLDGGRDVVHAKCDLRLAATESAIDLALVIGTERPQRVAGRLERLIPVRRPGRDGTVIETTFALVRAQSRCAGWVEITVASTGSAPHA